MTELAVTAFVVLLIWGAMKIPSLGDAIGRRVRGPGRPARRPAPPPEPAKILRVRSP
jgi:sec-independent protein translocase protein TatA